MKIKLFITIATATILLGLACLGVYIDSQTRFDHYVGKAHCHAQYR